MPPIRPFRALHYDFARTPDLGPVLAPPYDVIDPAMRDALEARDPHNVVRLELEKERPGDLGAENRYTRSARWLAEWLSSGVLVRDETPSLYVLEQRFELDGRPVARRGFFARLELHPFEERVVLPHEKTLSGPRQDRLALYEAVRTNVSPIFVLYGDERNELQGVLDRACERPPDAHGRTDDGADNRLWRVTDRAVIDAVVNGLRARTGYIADGHHRYETGLAYARRCEEREPGLPPDGAHRHTLAFFCGMSDPGLVVQPTHRLVYGLPGLRTERVFTLLEEHFEIERIDEDVLRPEGLRAALQRLADAGRRSHAMLAVSREDGAVRLLRRKEGIDLAHIASLPRSPTLRALDVTVLHGLVMQGVLGLSPESQERKENLDYVKDAAETVARVLGPPDAHAHQLGFLLNPTPMWQVRVVAEAGEVMPQKSTYFFPKVPTGLLLNPIDPHDRD